jgi:hypothetical protein
VDAFISHSSEDAEIAGSVKEMLTEAGLTSWIDRSELQIGEMLRDGILAALRDSRVVILLWSKAASKSRWVASELLSCYHLEHFIVPVSLDKALLPQFLRNKLYLDAFHLGKEVFANLPRAVREAPNAANQLSPMMTSQTVEQSLTGLNIAFAQREELAAMRPGSLDEARKKHTEVDAMIRTAQKKRKYDSMILACAGYHYKNAYQLKHWDAIQASRQPPDPLLLRAERKFFETLFVNPEDPSGLDGLASILMLEQEFYAAEFFLLRAIEFARRAGGPYPEAEANLALVRRHIPTRSQPTRQPPDT